MKQKTVFILGSERSGSNLLRVLLDNHSLLSAPVPVHFLEYFRPIFSHYIKLKNYNYLLEDMLQLANHAFSDWQLELTYPSKVHSLMHAFDYISNAKAAKEGKKHYVCKDNHLFQHIDLISSYFSDPYFLYLYRDPRDQAVSWLKQPIYLKTPYQIANKWRSEQKKCIELFESGVKMHFVRYENLVSDTENTMQDIIHYLGLEWEAACGQVISEKNKKDAERNPYWKNIDKPIIKDNFSKFKSFLSDEDISIIETLTQEQMLYLGYETISKNIWTKGNSFLFNIKEKIRERQTVKQINESQKKALNILQDKIKLMRTIRKKRQ